MSTKKSLCVVVVLLSAGILSAAPSVALNGNMFIYVPGNLPGNYTYDTDGNPVLVSHVGSLMRNVWTDGVPAGLNQSFATFNEDVTGDPDYYGYLNVDLYNHNVILAAANAQPVRQTTIYSVNGATGAVSPIWNATSSVGYESKLCVDPVSGGRPIPDVYIVSMPDRYARFFSDTSGDGIFQTTERNPLPMNGAHSAWGSGSTLKHDVEFYGGWAFFTSADTRDSTHWISRLNNVDNSATVAMNWSAWPGYPFGIADPWSDGRSYFDIGDPDGDTHADIVAVLGSASMAQISNALGHWEDLNNDLKFTSDEFVGSTPLGFSAWNVARDIELVTDNAGHSMALVLKTNGDVAYYNLDSTGAFIAASDGGQGLLTSGTGLSGIDHDEFMYLKFDPIPEPASLLLLGSGLLGLAPLLRRTTK